MSGFLRFLWVHQVKLLHNLRRNKGMNLVQRDIVYNYMTFELLVSMVELSRINADRFKNIEHLNYPMRSMTSFDTGRQTGKSTAISRYIKENPNSIVILHNNNAKLDMKKRLSNIKDYRVLTLSDFSQDSNTFRGLRGEFDLIFDECSYDVVTKCINSLVKFSSIKIKSVVKVGL